MENSSHPNNNNFTPQVNGENEDAHHLSDHLHQFFITHSATGRGGGGECSETAAMTTVQTEHMFEKVVTPSDVGKLNRLVIPKQHAEKYFPLDSSNNEKGLHLNFEDCNGKLWRFRYSYWNSSQSYVMTKGWSRFVKEKKLGAGDIVSFLYGIGEKGKNRFYIDWRRRLDAPPLPPPPVAPFSLFRSYRKSLYFPPQTREQQVHFLDTHHNHVHNNFCGPSSFVYLKSNGVGGGGGDVRCQRRTRVFESVVPVVQGIVASKRLRLFGVNMECPIFESSSTGNECELVDSRAIDQHQPFRPVISSNENVNRKRSNAT
ncbi:hypothetical protein Leryth_023328 [Lithospermum erythrorhizon]|uniref:DNA-binding transcription factor n=1 Tax=Lithospermum erythrorhizon TaxID=34254 RepID=A0AAV3NW92_LITER|nr:hypothetical protein Leryth_023328 [Lithospermum erythrorhizon]